MAGLNTEGELPMGGIGADALGEDSVDRGALPVIDRGEELLGPPRVAPAVGRPHREAAKEEAALSMRFKGAEERWERGDRTLGVREMPAALVFLLAFAGDSVGEIEDDQSPGEGRAWGRRLTPPPRCPAIETACVGRWTPSSRARPRASFDFEPEVLKPQDGSAT